MKRKTLPLVLAACVAAGSLVACAPADRDAERICVSKVTREPVEGDWCESAPYGYEWADGDDPDFDKIKVKWKPGTGVKPVVPQPKQPVVVKPPTTVTGGKRGK